MVSRDFRVKGLVGFSVVRNLSTSIFALKHEPGSKS